MAVVLSDTEVLAMLRPRDAVRWMADAAVAAHRGELVAPARISADLDDGALVVTAGSLRGRWYGYRTYDTLGLVAAEQVVALHDGASGRLHALAVGAELGPRRTGAIGGAAADALSRTDASVLALVGAGVQAWTQLWAIAAIRDLAQIRVFARDQGHREAFARRVDERYDVPVRAVTSARDAVDGADLVVCATTSTVPVVEAGWLAPGAYVATLGPKRPDAGELAPDVWEAADVVVTDSLAQAEANGTPAGDRLVSLGAVLDDAAPGRTGPDDLCVFSSVGLAGTEPYLVAKLTGLG